jgi:hypothetical protein
MPAGGGGGCSQATAFLARTSGLSGTQSTAYTTMICGMVTDGTFSLFDGLYVFATNTTTTAGLNLVSTSFTLTSNGSCTFTANAGYTGDAASCYQDPGFVPSSAAGNMTQNSAHIAVCDLTNRTSHNGSIQLGAGDTAYSYVSMGGGTESDLNGFTFTTNGTPTNSQSNGYAYVERRFNLVPEWQQFLDTERYQYRIAK